MAPRWRAAAGDGELGGGATERSGVREVGKNGEGMEEARMPYLAWARAQRGGVVRDGRRSRAVAIGGNGRWRSGIGGSGAAPSPLL